MTLGIIDRKVGMAAMLGDLDRVKPEFGKLGELDDMKGPFSFIFPGKVKVEDELDLKMGRDAGSDRLHNFDKSGLEVEVVILDELFYRDQVVLDSQEPDFMKIGKLHVELPHRLQLFSLELPILRQVQSVKILLASSNPQELERNRVAYSSHGNDWKIVQDCGIAVPESDPGKPFLGVLVFEGMGKKGIGHSRNVGIINRTGECIIEDSGNGVNDDGHFFPT
jgi:hypothetical protein